MGKHVAIKSVALRVTLFFARNPEEELTSKDIAEKFGIPDAEVHSRMSRAVRDGMLAKATCGPGRGRLVVYAAGQALLVMIGERRLLERRHEEREGENRRITIGACMPVGGA